MSKKIAISQLGQLEYCEYKIYFKNWLKKQKKTVPVVISKEIIDGAKAHHELKESHIEIDTKELVNKRELSVSCETLRGRVDEIIKTPTYIKIIDDKAHDTAYNGDKWQVYGYCKAYKEQHGDELSDTMEVIGAIRNWKTGSIIWEQEFTTVEDKIVTAKVDKILGILDGTVTATSSDNPFKCNKCNLKKSCDKSLYKEFNIKDLIG